MAIYHVLGVLNPKRGFVSAADAKSDNKKLREHVALELDALVNENPEYSATATKNAVEHGADITDHVALSPLTLSIEGVITNTPTSLVKIASGATFKNPAHDGYVFLKSLWKDRQPFTFVGGLESYENMVITSLSASRRAATGDALMFTCRMQQINLVESKEIHIGMLYKKDAPKAMPPQDKGFQPMGTFQNVQTTAKVGNATTDQADYMKFTQGGGAYPLSGLPMVK